MKYIFINIIITSISERNNNIIHIYMNTLNYYEQFDFARYNMIATHVIARKLNAYKINCI